MPKSTVRREPQATHSRAPCPICMPSLCERTMLVRAPLERASGSRKGSWRRLLCDWRERRPYRIAPGRYAVSRARRQYVADAPPTGPPSGAPSPLNKPKNLHGSNPFCCNIRSTIVGMGRALAGGLGGGGMAVCLSSGALAGAQRLACGQGQGATAGTQSRCGTLCYLGTEVRRRHHTVTSPNFFPLEILSSECLLNLTFHPLMETSSSCLFSIKRLRAASTSSSTAPSAGGASWGAPWCAAWVCGRLGVLLRWCQHWHTPTLTF